MGPAIRAAPASHPISQEAPGSSPDVFDGSDCDDAHLSDGELVMDSSEKEVSVLLLACLLVLRHHIMKLASQRDPDMVCRTEVVSRTGTSH